MKELLHSVRSGGTLLRRWPRSRYRLTDRPDCSACTDESRSLSPQSANCEDRRFLDLPLSKSTTAGNKPLSSRPSTRIYRQLNGPARARAPSVDQPRQSPPVEYMQLAISRSLRSSSSPEPQLPIPVPTISITHFWRPDHPFSVRSRGSPFRRETRCLAVSCDRAAVATIEWKRS